MRPVSIRKPTEATAITATTVAIVPRRVPSSQRTAETMTPDPCGSDKLSCAQAAEPWTVASKAANAAAARLLPEKPILPPMCDSPTDTARPGGACQHLMDKAQFQEREAGRGWRGGRTHSGSR